MNKEFICIVCPKGCHISVDEDGNITGYTCKRGLNYVSQELVDPRRVLTSTVLVKNGKLRVCPVKSNIGVPKDKMFDIIDAIDSTSITAPVKIGDVVISNVLNLGIDVIATKNIDHE